MGNKNKKRTGNSTGKKKRSKPAKNKQRRPADDEDVASSGSDVEHNDSNAAVDWDNLDYEDPREDVEVEELIAPDDDNNGVDANAAQSASLTGNRVQGQADGRTDRTTSGATVTTRVWLPGQAWSKSVATAAEGSGLAAAAAADPSLTSSAAAVDGDGGLGELTYDPTAYDMLHALRMEWPCLSFDVMRDALGMQRRRFPHTMFLAAGTQADQADRNQVLVMKLSELARTGGGVDEDDGEGALDSDSEEENDPVVAVRAIRHQGGVNRLRCLPQQPQILATWADTGKVHVFSVANQFEQVRRQTGGPGAAGDLVAAKGKGKHGGAALVAPLQSFTAHPTEGFALAWSPQQTGRLLTGDCRKHIYLWEPQGSSLTGWASNAAPYVGHSDSVEDVQWKPDENNVFASCSMDRTIKIWDARVKQQPALSVVAHECDVNVLAWNPRVSYLVASGADDGSFRIFDLRSLGDGKPEAQFQWHQAPITSLEWSPDEESVLAVSCDQQATVWDLSLERDADEEAEAQLGGELPLPDDVPAQLMFVHMGQSYIKELHWHSQIPGALVSTAADGMNVWRPSNL